MKKAFAILSGLCFILAFVSIAVGLDDVLRPETRPTYADPAVATLYNAGLLIPVGVAGLAVGILFYYLWRRTPE